MEFEWDNRKAELNEGKHGVTFNEAAEAFKDSNAVEFFDESNSETEIRFRLLACLFAKTTFVYRLYNSRRRGYSDNHCKKSDIGGKEVLLR